jgi:hypothetical protein
MQAGRRSNIASPLLQALAPESVVNFACEVDNPGSSPGPPCKPLPQKRNVGRGLGACLMGHRRRIEDVRIPVVKGLPDDIYHMLHHSYVSFLTYAVTARWNSACAVCVDHPSCKQAFRSLAPACGGGASSPPAPGNLRGFFILRCEITTQAASNLAHQPAC